MAKNNTDNFYIDRAKWLDYVHARRDFNHAWFRVAYFIVSKINPEDDCMWWTVKNIAKGAGVGTATAEKAISALDDCRLIYIGAKKIGRQTVKTYSFRMPLDAEDQAFKAERKKRKKTGGRKRRGSLNEIRRVSLNENKSNNAESNNGTLVI